MAFDRTAARELVAGLTPYQRGVAASLVLHRLAAIVEDGRMAAGAPESDQLVADSVGYCLARCVGEPAGSDEDELWDRFRSVLGPDDDPFEEPEGLDAYYVDLVSLADYAVRTWVDTEASGDRCFQVMLAGYDLVGFLEDEPEAPAPEPLADLEADRQLADLRSLSGVDQLDEPGLRQLIDASERLRTAYAARFELVS